MNNHRDPVIAHAAGAPAAPHKAVKREGELGKQK
jgi:hypothetical protein